MRWMLDPKDPEEAPNGRGNADWYCERLWAKESTLTGERDRGKCQKELATDLKKNSLWRAKRAKEVEKIKMKLEKGIGATDKRKGGVKQVRVKKRHIKETALLRPDDWFYPIVLVFFVCSYSDGND